MVYSTGRVKLHKKLGSEALSVMSNPISDDRGGKNRSWPDP